MRMNERMIGINNIFKQYTSPPKYSEYTPVSEYNDKISRNQALEDFSVLRYLMKNRYCGWEFFENNGIGSDLIGFAVREKGCDHLWVLEKNLDAQRFYKRNGFAKSGQKKLEEGTDEYIIEMRRSAE